MKNINKIIQEQLEKHLLLEERGLIKQLESIAKKYLGVKSLTTSKKSPSDIHSVSTYNIKSALTAAYKLGKSSTSVEESKKKPLKESKEPNKKVDDAYDSIINLLRKKSRALNDDDAFELHEKLKGFFNKLI